MVGRRLVVFLRRMSEHPFRRPKVPRLVFGRHHAPQDRRVAPGVAVRKVDAGGESVNDRVGLFHHVHNYVAGDPRFSDPEYMPLFRETGFAEISAKYFRRFCEIW
jgi:hypothetical protein